jgi:glycosyltransferase involved in cell wall biosynthesis
VTPDVSFVIPAHNEQDVIAESIRSIHYSARGLSLAYEIVVADDASTDATARASQFEGARVISIARRQIAAARNAGAAASLGRVLVFVDADTIVSPALLEAAMRAISAGHVGGGAHVAFDEPVPLYARVVVTAFLWVYSRFGLAAGCFIFCRRDAFDAVGGFDEQFFAGEEIEFSRALARRGTFIVLPERVLTSSRKLRTHTAREVLGTFVRTAFTWRRTVRSRDRLALWYGPRRRDRLPAVRRRLD